MSGPGQLSGFKGEKPPPGAAQAPQLKNDVIPFYRNCPWLSYFDWHIRFWVYFDSIPHGIAWYASAGFYIGSYFFIIGSFAAISPHIVNTVGDCGDDAYDILITHLYFIGTFLWFFACYFQMCDAANHGYDAVYEEWLIAGCPKGGKPRYNWLPFTPLSAEYWGATLYTLGIVVFLIASVSAEIMDCPGHAEADDVVAWTYYYMYMAGGFMFFLAGCLYIFAWESKWLIPGIIPMCWKDLSSFRWWGLWFYFWGGAMYAESGVFFYWLTPENYTLSFRNYQIEFGIGYGAGTVFYFIGAICLLCRLSRARCRRSYPMIHGRLEPSNVPNQNDPEQRTPILPVRYSMDKALTTPLPTLKRYSIAEARTVIRDNIVEARNTGMERFTRHSYIPMAPQEPLPQQSKPNFMRNSYFEPRRMSGFTVNDGALEGKLGPLYSVSEGSLNSTSMSSDHPLV